MQMNGRKDGSLKSCAFTGYRPQKLPFGFDEDDPRCIDFKARIAEAVEARACDGYTHFISGGALGMDLFAAEAVLKLREELPWITLEVAVPFEKQADKWNEEFKARYYRIIASADKVSIISSEYSKGCMFRRNRYMVDHADLLMAAYDSQPGGTAMTVEYARKKHIEIQIISPRIIVVVGDGRRKDETTRSSTHPMEPGGRSP